MSLLLDERGIAARRAVVAGALAPLAEGLHAELAPVLDGRCEIPREKALLSRTGGRCPHDGTFLAFDPLDPRHRCPRCGIEATGDMHDRFRPYWYQLWLAERVLHAATLGVLRDDAACRRAAMSLLGAYAQQYLSYPNRDNVLGPSRPFFSTYLESIWLLQLTLALDLLEADSQSEEMRALGGVVRDRLIAPSAEIIRSYDEGMSNRQVWNDAALIAAGSLLQDPTMVERAIEGGSGLHAHLGHSLLDDGSWYEGENYHLFAHRGLWYGVTMAERLGFALPAPLVAKFDAGFVAPFRTLLPDLTYPSRRDSQYAVSVRQPRFAESCELGLARREEKRLIGMLARLYDPSVPRGDTGRAASTADVERNLPATGLSRADLSWRSLLFARAELPVLVPIAMESDLLPSQGFGIIRRDEGRVYVALDYGHSGGGHGHPDRLNVLLCDGQTRWFDDPGTGSYTDESLHWYRSTLAHNAPLIDRRSQPRVHGELQAFEDGGEFGVVIGKAPLADGLTVCRKIAVGGSYLVDKLVWGMFAAERDLDLPIHGVRALAADGSALHASPAPIDGSTGAEDGFAFLWDIARLHVPSDFMLKLESTQGDRTLSGWLFLTPGTECWSAVAPGAPGHSAQPLILLRSRGRAGAIVALWSWRGEVVSASRYGGAAEVILANGEVHTHSELGAGWRITAESREERRVVELGQQPAALASPSDLVRSAAPPSPISIPMHSIPFEIALGELNYRGSEQSWDEAGRAAATVRLAIESDRRTLVITIEVPRSDRRFVAIDAENPFDNEPAAINGDGVQLYVVAGEDCAGWLLVPEQGSDRVAARPIDGWSGTLGARASWAERSGGYRMVVRIDLPDDLSELAADVIVNEIAADRARRRGQLVMSGAAGEFVYLRGDRHDRERLLRFSLAE